MEIQYRCKICGRVVAPFTESKHLEQEHGIVVKKLSDLARRYETIKG